MKVFLRPKNFDELAPVVTYRASRKIGTTFEAANLMTAWCHNAVDRIVIANDALLEISKRKSE